MGRYESRDEDYEEINAMELFKKRHEMMDSYVKAAAQKPIIYHDGTAL